MSKKFSSFFKNTVTSPKSDRVEWEKFLQSVAQIQCEERVLPASEPRSRVHKPTQPLALEDVPVHPFEPTNLTRRSQRKVRYEASLDLHGMNKREALESMTRFIAASSRKNLKCILIITGKGRSAPGALKTLFLHVLQSPGVRPLIRQTSQAKPADGGSGAFYVFLRPSLN
jgi:DNA-nicking Smr family endonuclease